MLMHQIHYSFFCYCTNNTLLHKEKKNINTNKKKASETEKISKCKLKKNYDPKNKDNTKCLMEEEFGDDNCLQQYFDFL